MTKKIGFDYFLQLFGLLISLIATPIFLRIVGNTEYSKWTLVLSYIALLGISDVGFGPKFVSGYRNNQDFFERQKLFSNSIVLFFILSILVTFLFIYFFKINELKISLFLIIISCFFNVFGLSEYLLLIHEKHKQYSIITSAVQIGTPLISFGYLMVFRNINAFLYGYLSIRLISFIYLSFNERWWTYIDFTRISIFEFRNIIKYSFWFLVSKLSRLIKDQLDIVLISIFLDSKFILIYALSTKLPLLLQSLLVRPSNFLVNSISREVSNANEKALSHYFVVIFRMIFYSTPLIALFYFFLVEYTIDKWVGSEYFAGKIFMLIVFFNIIKEIFFHYIGLVYLFSSLKNLAIIQSLEFTINISLSLILIKIFGLTGLVISTAISSSIFMIFLLPKILKGVIGNTELYTLNTVKIFGITLFSSVVFNYLSGNNFLSIELKFIIFLLLLYFSFRFLWRSNVLTEITLFNNA
jgi:O-antigen/teichoic acid export membrane protein